MKRLLLSFVLSTVFVAASTDDQAGQEAGQGGVTLVQSAANGTGSGVPQASDLNAGKRTDAAQEPQNALTGTNNDAPAGQKERKIRIAFLSCYPRAEGSLDFTVSVLVAAWGGLRDNVLPEVLTRRFAFGLVTGLTTAYFFPASCK